jgi:hypothetical protein
VRVGAVLALAGTLALAAAPSGADGPVEVRYLDPRRFADVRDGQPGTEAGRDQLLALLKTHLEAAGRTRLPQNHVLVVIIADVDLAGDFEPWRGPRFDRVRIYRDVYPPRVTLSFTLTDGDGRVVAEGRRQLVDLDYLIRPSLSDADPLRYDKALLDQWLSREFPPP